MKPVRTLLVLGMGLIIACGSAVVAETPNSAQANANMVRATYSKLVIASRLSAIREKYTSGGNRGRLNVTLSEIKTGPVSEIRTELLADLVAKPAGRTLAVTPVTWTYKTTTGQEFRAEGATAVWQDSGYLAEDWNLPLGRLFDIGTLDPGYTEYASFTVNLSYLGEHRQYQALFLFGQDASGKAITLPIDNIIGDSALQALIQAPSTPDPLLADRFRERPATRAFLESLQAPEGCSVESRTQMCCDQASGMCGVSIATLRQHGFTVSQSMSFPDTGKESPECEFNCSIFNSTGVADPKADKIWQQDHVTGYHTGKATFTPHCTYGGTTTPCVPLCSVAVTGEASTETGLTKVYCHKVPANETTIDGEGNNTCSASWGYGVGGCFLCIPCSVSVTVGAATSGGSASVSVSGGNATLWTYGAGLVAGPCATKD